ncbi:acyl-CoA oxidase 2 [Phyllostomus discolor]|uniref:Acyl-CoA oxidase 2 n=1 Tax=Phyllostomus discolor TaxID=89673 RepID=A0A833ZTC8_9CHIR|nr:acyl-CoA oxidase 2 [Phyllostomus discolor]
MNFEHADNGFLRLDHVRIPRENMLNRFAKVLPDGTYVKLGTAQSNYLTMVVSRVELLLSEIIPLLKKACVIAIRYSVIRRQSQLRPRQVTQKQKSWTIRLSSRNSFLSWPQPMLSTLWQAAFWISSKGPTVPFWTETSATCLSFMH